MGDDTTTYKIRRSTMYGHDQYKIDRDGLRVGLVDSLPDAHEFIDQDIQAEKIRGRVRIDYRPN